MFAPGVAGVTVALTIMNACTLFAWWGFNLWLPGFLALPVAQGGVGLSTAAMSGFVVAMQIGMWCGYVTFGFISDALGRKRVYITYLIVAAVLLFIYVSVRTPIVLLLLGPFVAFFATGYYSGFGAVTAEVYPTHIRATAQGFTYNIGRVASAVAPLRRRLPRADPRLQCGAVDLLGGVPARGLHLDLDPRDGRPRARLIGTRLLPAAGCACSALPR